jgi:hypothetical protein
LNRNYDAEFATVDLVRNSTAETRGVDAFCLAWIKYERQARKLCSFLLFQASTIQAGDAPQLRAALHAKTDTTHAKFRSAIQSLGGIKLKDEFGARYHVLEHNLDQAFRARNKIFHGQQTGQGLKRERLVELVDYIKEWCKLLADAAMQKFGYDGFAGANSMVKGHNSELTATVDKALANAGWEQFVQTRL